MKGKDASALVGIVLLYVALESFGVTCPIKFLTGISCAGCGMSRAWLALLSGNAGAALAYHPLVLVPILAALLFLLRKRLPKKLVDAGLWSCGILFVAVYVIRLALPGDVVVFAPQEGAVWRLAARLMGGMG